MRIPDETKRENAGVVSDIADQHTISILTLA
jgi:hypothetical protein